MSSEEERGFPEGEHKIPEETIRQLEKPPVQQTKAVQAKIATEQSKAMSELDAAFSYSDAPVQHIDLPSRGVLYDGCVPDGKLEVKPLTAREEKLLAGASGDLTDVMDTIFKRCVIMKNGMTPNDFLSSDRFFTLLMLRANSYGEEYGFSVTCDSCGFSFEKSIEIPSGFEISYLEDGASEPFEVTLPSGKRVGFRLPRGSDEVRIAKYSEKMLGRGKKKKVAKSDDGDPSYIYRVALLIVSLDGYDVSDMSLMDRKMEFVEGLIGKDSMRLQTAIRDHDCGVDTEMRERCPRCNTVNQFTLPFTAEFFRPAP